MSTSCRMPLDDSLRIVESQHREIFDLADRFLIAIARAEEPARVAAMVRTLTNFLRLHIDVEENLMKRAGYPGFADHRPHHLSLLDKIGAIVGKNERGELVAKEVEGLIESFVLHHDNADQSFLAFIRTVPAACAPAPVS